MHGPELGLQLVPIAGIKIGFKVLADHQRQQRVAEVGCIALRIKSNVGSLTGKCLAQREHRASSNMADGTETFEHEGSIAMTSVFASAIDGLFADSNIARDATYIAHGGTPQLVRVITRRADEVTGFGEARLWSETTRVDLRVSEVANPRPGDRIEIEGEAFNIQGEPMRDRERLVWTVNLRPA